MAAPSLPLNTDCSIMVLIHQNANYLLNANSLSIYRSLLLPAIPSTLGTHGGIEHERTIELAYPATLVPNPFSPGKDVS